MFLEKILENNLMFSVNKLKKRDISLNCKVKVAHSVNAKRFSVLVNKAAV